MESYDYLSELSNTVSGSATHRRLREAHAAMVELDGERGQAVCVWHAGCNTALIDSHLVPSDSADDTA